MEYIISQLFYHKEGQYGPTLEVRANPYNASAKFQSKEYLEVTVFFWFRATQQIIDAFSKAGDDHILWNPNLDEYKKATIKYFHIENQVVYLHKSLLENTEIIIDKILPHPTKKYSDVRSINNHFQKPIDTMSEYVEFGKNSFDYLLNEFDHRKKLYAYPLFLSQNFRKVMDRCRFSQFWKEGVYLRNDIIQPEPKSPDCLKHSLLCCGYNRYYTSYMTQEEIHIWYRFYNKRASHLLYKMFTELEDYEPFNRFVIEENDIIGFVCCDVTDFDGGKESVLYMLTDEPIEYNRSNTFNYYDADYQKTYIVSKYLNGNASKILTWSFIYEFQKQAGIDKKGYKLAINDSEKSSCLIAYICSHYDQMSDIEKDMCAYIIPEKYSLTTQEVMQKEWLHSYVVNLGTLVRTSGLVLTKTIPFALESVPKQIDKVLEVIDKRKKYLLDTNIDCRYDVILALLVINYGVQGALRNLTGLWTYYHLINLKESTDLANELLLFVYKNNQHLFSKLIEKVKVREIVQERIVKGWFSTKVVEDRTSWKNRDNMSCYFEIFDMYSNHGNGYTLTEKENKFVCEHLRHEIDNNSAEVYFKNNPDGNHTTLNVENEKTFYKNELENYVNNRIRQNDYIFKEITM